jgi:glycolate oxidase iron-sulfur subunit
LHFHSGDEPTARKLAAANCQAFGMDLPEGFEKLDAIITNAAGCGAMLKDYAHTMHDHPAAEAAERFNAKVRDIHEFLYELGPVKPKHRLPVQVTYHDACHLRHAQQIQKQPRSLLELVPGLTLIPLPESELCCGAAGSYNLTQPDMATRLGDRKVENILATGASVMLTGNVGCLMQITRHLRHAGGNVWAAHPMDLLWASYSGEIPPELQTHLRS